MKRTTFNFLTNLSLLLGLLQAAPIQATSGTDQVIGDGPIQYVPPLPKPRKHLKNTYKRPALNAASAMVHGLSYFPAGSTAPAAQTPVAPEQTAQSDTPADNSTPANSPMPAAEVMAIMKGTIQVDPNTAHQANVAYYGPDGMYYHDPKVIAEMAAGGPGSAPDCSKLMAESSRPMPFITGTNADGTVTCDWSCNTGNMPPAQAAQMVAQFSFDYNYFRYMATLPANQQDQSVTMRGWDPYKLMQMRVADNMKTVSTGDPSAQMFASAAPAASGSSSPVSTDYKAAPWGTLKGACH